MSNLKLKRGFEGQTVTNRRRIVCKKCYGITGNLSSFTAPMGRE